VIIEETKIHQKCRAPLVLQQSVLMAAMGTLMAKSAFT
jgi:hypothetical protein